jgi:protein-disulfide isomerase
MNNETRKLVLPVAERDHLQGAADAPLALVEYGDYECSYCGEAYPIIKAVQKQLGDRLCFAFRNFPLVHSHPHAEHAAEAAEAAGAQGKFWQMHDVLFENQGALEDEDLARYAAALGLDAGRLMDEIVAEAHLGRIREDVKNGAREGVNGTPTLFVNGVRFDEEPDVKTLVAALKQGQAPK